MLDKIAGLARALAIILAIVAAFVQVPGIDMIVAIILLSLFAGLSMREPAALSALLVLAIALPVISAAVALLPVAGSYLAAIATNIGIGAASACFTGAMLACLNTVRGDVTAFGK